MIAVTIDEYTPCLKNTKTGEIVETEVIRFRRKASWQSTTSAPAGISIGASFLPARKSTRS